jgi:hypothetical protein
MRAFAAALTCLALAAPASADSITGRVVDAAGRPVPGAEVATSWSFTAEGAAHKGAITTEAGAFELEVNFYNRPSAIMALSADRTRAGVIIVQPDQADAEHTITLGPVVEVTGDFFCPEFKAKPEWTNVYMSLMPPAGEDNAFPIRIASCSSNSADFRFALPPGEYQFWGYGTDVQNLRRPLTLSADAQRLAMGTLELEATIIARHYGKPPPAINVTEARGAPVEVALADYRNQWLLVEFWGYW